MTALRRSRVLAGSSALLVAAAARPARAQSSAIAVRVGTTANDTYAQAYYAQDAGFFQKAGLSADVQTLNTGTAASAAVAAGTLDFAVSTPVGLANALIRGIPFVVVAPGSIATARYAPGLACVAKDGPVRSPKDLEGKIVSIPTLKTLTEAALDLWLEKNGVEVAKIRTVETIIAEMGVAVERGTVAAAIINEPSLSVALKTNNLRSLGNPFLAVAPQFLVACWFTTTTYAQKNPDTVKRFRTAIVEAGKWANGHRGDSAVILAKWTKTDLEVVRGMSRCPYSDQLRPADMQTELDVAARFGVIPKAVSAADLLGR
jgi:NitT/TauT family transport system substrate-binding protein